MFEPLTPLAGLAASEEWAVIFAFVMMGLDFLVGIVAACIRQEFKSAKVREGLGHKAMCVFIIVLAFVVQQASGVVGDLGFDVPLIVPVCVIIIVMEVSSVLETVGDTYPDLKNSRIYDLFKNANKDDETK